MKNNKVREKKKKILKNHVVIGEKKEKNMV